MENYLDAANRHNADAKLLHSQPSPRLANASHLFGIAAECAVKTVIKNNGGAVAGNSVFGHINQSQLLQRFVTCQAIQGKAQFQADMLSAITVFRTWDASQRYSTQTDIQFTPARLTAECNAAASLLSLRDQWLQGVI